MSKKKTKKRNEITSKTELSEEESLIILDALKTDDRPRMLSLYSEINDESSAEIVNSLMVLKDLDREPVFEDPADATSEIIDYVHKPIELIISSWGGEALNMFAIYDAMRIARKKCDVSTIGLGKVMSAGVLLLASGTKGKRRIGANCRVMLHSVCGGQVGSLHNLENEMAETRWIQKQHIKALLEETSMTPRQLKTLLNKKINVYFDAEQAVKYGIADEIV